MYEDIGRSLSTDYFLIADQLTREELSYLQRTRDFVEVLPVINGTGSGRSSRGRWWRSSPSSGSWATASMARAHGAQPGRRQPGHVRGRACRAGARRHPQRGGVGRTRARNSGVRGPPAHPVGKPLVSFQIVQDRLGLTPAADVPGLRACV